MNLNVSDWKTFYIGRLFTMLNGKGITQEEITDNQGCFTAVQSGEENNGVMGKIDINYCKQMKYTYTEKSCLTVARSGSAGFVSYQHEGCVVGDSAKILLLPDEVATTEHYLFMQAMLTANRFKYTYGRKVTEDKYLNDVVDLPVQRNADGSIFIDDTKKYSDKGYVPDWQFMEDYIKSLHHKPLTTKNKSGQAPALNVQDWGEFRVGSLFRLEPTKGIVTDDLIEGFDVPYMAAKHDGNGIEMTCSKDGVEDWISKGNCIVFVNLGAGSAGYANYIKEDFIGMSGKTTCGYNSHLNEWNGLFIATCLCQERPKYSFGRSWTGDRLKDTIIKLPIQRDMSSNPVIDANKTYSDEGYIPDWQFMEDYIKALPYGDRLEG